MPGLTIATSAPAEKVTDALLAELTTAVASGLGKPESACMVHVTGGQKMAMGGKPGGCAMGTLFSVGALAPANTAAVQRGVAAALEKHLGVSTNYIFYRDVKLSEVGFKGQMYG